MKTTVINCIRHLGAILFAAAILSAATAAPVDMNQRAEDLKNLKWGMFICWSFSTFSGKEWTPGISDISFFRATSVDTDQWARTAKEAGMGYILFLAKHHDGFCLWDTKTTDRKVTKAPLGRDVLAELKKSCEKHGIKLAIYFSEGEWQWPNQPNGTRYDNDGGYNPELKKAQLKELLTQYGPVEYIWFDHAVGDGGLNHVETTEWCKQFQPGCFIGYNHGQSAGDIRLGELGRPGPLDTKTGIGQDHGDSNYRGYLLAEFTYPIQPKRPKGAMWFYSHPDNEDACHEPEKLYNDYLGAVKFGNIFALDIGPNYDGKLRDIDVSTLRKIGAWIRNPSLAPRPPISFGKPATASSCWGASYEADKACDDNTETRWAAAPESLNGWLELDLGKNEKIGRVEIIEASYPRTEEFTIEYLQGKTWKELARGTTIGAKKGIEFSPVTTRQIRLNILKANEVPSIDEFRVFPPGESTHR